MYFFGNKSTLNKKVSMKVLEKRKSIKREAVVIHDDKDLIVVKYTDLGLREGFNQGDFADGTAVILSVEGSVA